MSIGTQVLSQQPGFLDLKALESADVIYTADTQQGYYARSDIFMAVLKKVSSLLGYVIYIGMHVRIFSIQY